MHKVQGSYYKFYWHIVGYGWDIGKTVKLNNFKCKVPENAKKVLNKNKKGLLVKSFSQKDWFWGVMEKNARSGSHKVYTTDPS